MLDESDDFLVNDVEWLDVCFLGVGCTPDGDVANEVGVCMCEVEVFERVCWEEFVGVFELVYEGPELFDDVGDGLGMLEVVLDGDP